MCPCRSQTKPEPDPCGTSKTFRDQKSRRKVLVVMKTTEREAASKTWMVDFSSAPRVGAGATSRGFASPELCGSPWTHEPEARATEAMISRQQAVRGPGLLMVPGVYTILPQGIKTPTRSSAGEKTPLQRRGK